MSAVPTILEKLVLQGKAQFRVMNHAFGSFGRIMLPKESFAVITKIIWYPFLNPQVDDLTNLTYGELFLKNQYQLKIDGNKTNNNYQFNNPIDFHITDSTFNYTLDDVIDPNDFYKYFHIKPSPPIIVDTYIVCQDVLTLTITRNVMQKPLTTYGPLQPIANQPPPPNGIGGQNVLLYTRLGTGNPNPQTMWYVPPYRDFSGYTGNDPRTSENYVQDVCQPDGAGNYRSMLTDVVNLGFMYQSYPLINFHMVVVNRNDWNNLMNS